VALEIILGGPRVGLIRHCQQCCEKHCIVA